MRERFKKRIIFDIRSLDWSKVVLYFEGIKARESSKLRHSQWGRSLGLSLFYNPHEPFLAKRLDTGSYAHTCSLLRRTRRCRLVESFWLTKRAVALFAGATDLSLSPSCFLSRTNTRSATLSLPPHNTPIFPLTRSILVPSSETSRRRLSLFFLPFFSREFTLFFLSVFLRVFLLFFTSLHSPSISSSSFASTLSYKNLNFDPVSLRRIKLLFLFVSLSRLCALFLVIVILFFFFFFFRKTDRSI